ncbi:hypothetical protein RSO01_33410 [Reyranella soli]|uniref:Uncharacterized protein n=1 Tax=Reyranella soli TaxID=1230389 RepID=A0A512NB61_9HYPH|nr:hypothetical protein RSO01_33410 [Reyranella soli]
MSNSRAKLLRRRTAQYMSAAAAANISRMPLDCPFHSYDDIIRAADGRPAEPEQLKQLNRFGNKALSPEALFNALETVGRADGGKCGPGAPSHWSGPCAAQERSDAHRVTGVFRWEPDPPANKRG